jgi:hypothetical protein
MAEPRGLLCRLTVHRTVISEIDARTFISEVENRAEHLARAVAALGDARINL